jgi:ribosome-binding ATPase YchF (GTP1/OBG family)
MSAKRILHVANVAEDDLAGESDAARAVLGYAADSGGEAVALCAKLESELDEADRAEMCEGLGLEESAIGPLARAVCRLLGGLRSSIRPARRRSRPPAGCGRRERAITSATAK